MLMICWFYCGPFVKLLYYALAPLMALFALFMLRRGVIRDNRAMRTRAFIVVFAACIKMFIFDLQELQAAIFCNTALGNILPLCSRGGFLFFGLLRIAALLASCMLVFHFYRRYLHCRARGLRPPHAVHMRVWANGALAAVLVLGVWTTLPWIGTLTTGTVPAIFGAVSWQLLAVLSGGLLLAAFWRAEECDWDPARHRHGRGLNAEETATWTPRDTLWTTAFIYLVTLAMAYVTHDVLT